MKEKVICGLRRYGRLLTGLGVLLCAAGLLISYVKPKQKLETVAVNMGSEGEERLAMEPGMTVRYTCDTKGYPMAGIQVGIVKYGKELADSRLLCSVYSGENRELLSETLVSLKDVDDGQYVYLPFDNYEQCLGTITVEFTADGPAGELPGLLMNKARLSDAFTEVNAERFDGNLKSYYIYRLDYYPLVFDLLVGLCLFAGVFFLSGKEEKAEGEKVDE